MNYPRSIMIGVTAAWGILMALALVLRPPLPVDETRYFAVAWEMWRDGGFLVPHLNGETYSHKPPLLFWLMHAGWALFGVNEWWPRLVAPLFALGSLWLVPPLARRLWPDTELGATAAVVLFGCVFWTLFGTVTMFDMMLVLAALVSLIGLLDAWKKPGIGGFLVMGIGIGVGVLAKGPAILLHVLPAALLAPWWGAGIKGGRPWKKWYAGVLGAVALGAAIGLLWAVPAAIMGGEEYRNAIFWGQSAGRMVESFAHQRPWWWYLAVLPALILPWTVWPLAWRGMARLPRFMTDGGLRFCLAWFLPAFVAFSLISGKQLHYLLPIFPALALVAVFLFKDMQPRPRDRLPPALLSLVIGAALLALPLVDGLVRLPEILDDAATHWGVLPLGFGLLLLLRKNTGTALLAGFSVVLVAAAHVTLGPHLDEAYDMRPLAVELKKWEDEGYAIANYGKYHGQYHFLGRLNRPLAVIGDGEVKDWLAANPKAKIVAYQKSLPEGGKPDLVQKFRRGLISVWDASLAGANPDLVKRGD